MFLDSTKPPAKEKSYSMGNWSKHANQARVRSEGTRNVMKENILRVQQMDAIPINNEIDPILVRKFEPLTTYDPFDFSMTKYKMERAQYFNSPKYDLFNASRQDPLEFWKNPDALSEYVTTNGRIIQGVQLGHSGKTQRRLAKAIRRARAAGLMPYFHKSVNNIPK